MPDMMFLIKFDPKTGERLSTIPYDNDITPEKAEAMLADGYELVPYEDWNLLIGNVDGKEYVKDIVHGSGYIEKPQKVPTLQEAQEVKIAELKNIRNAKEVAPLNNFDVDERSITRLQIAQKVLAQSGGTVDWTMADNTVKAIAAEDISAVFIALAIRSTELHAQYRGLKASVMAATTNEEINTIEWTEG